MPGFGNQAPAPGNESEKEKQIPLLLELPSSPQDVTEAHYDMLESRYGGMFDRYEEEGRIRDGVFQGALWIEVYKKLKDELPQWLLESYLRTKRSYRFSNYEKTAIRSTVRRVPAPPASSLKPPKTPPIITQKDKSGNDYSLEED